MTKDGKRIKLLMNAGLLVDLPQLAESGAEGIGLFRTELQFMIASTMPKAEEQEDFYRNVLKQAAGGRLPSARSISAATRSCPISALGGRKSGARLAGDPPVARPAGAFAHAVARHAEGLGGPS